jgi:hypothetical protein
MSSRTEPTMNTRNDRVLAISWEDHRRTREICDWFGFQLHVLNFDGGRWQRYLRLGTATIGLLWRQRPPVVFLQTPSVVLALIVFLLRPLCGRYRIIMDAHNEAVAPFTHTRWPVPLLHRLTIRGADLTIVTNSALAPDIQRIGGRPLVLPDRMPTPPVAPAADVPLTDVFHVMVVATYAADEPIAEIIAAARSLGSGYLFSITGRETRLPPEQRAALPANVRQTGFLPEHDYWVLMNECHAMLDFTLKPNCLVCGAYEALALKRPMILSNNPATVALFGRVAVFPATHGVTDIAAAVSDCRARYAELCVTAAAEQPRFAAGWQQQAAVLQKHIEEWLCAYPAQRSLNVRRDSN